MLNDVIEFCWKNNIALPSHQIEDESNLDSASLHSIVDKVEEENCMLWKNICKQLRSGILVLMKNGSPYYKHDAKKNFEYEIFLLELLNTIFSFDLVFDEYCRIQKEEFDILYGNSSVFNISDSISALERVALRELNLIIDVYRLLSHFIKGNQREQLLKRFLESYLEVVNLHIGNFLDLYDNKITCGQINLEIKIDPHEGTPFTVHDLKSFSRVFHILYNWSSDIDKTLVNILRQISKSKSHHIMDQSLDSSHLSEIQSWEAQFKPYQPFLIKVVSLYIKCTFDSIFNREENPLMVLVTKELFQDKSIPRKVTTVSTTMRNFMLPHRPNY